MLENLGREKASKFSLFFTPEYIKINLNIFNKETCCGTQYYQTPRFL
jgi:hypothetical protein